MQSAHVLPQRDKPWPVRTERVKRARAKTPSTPEPGFPATRLRRNRRVGLVAAARARDDAHRRRSDLADLPHRRDKRQRTPVASHAGGRAALDRSRRQGRRRRGRARHSGDRALSQYRSLAARRAGERGAQSRTISCAAPCAPSSRRCRDIGVICDVALDPYTSHGHDGLLRRRRDRQRPHASRCWCARRWCRPRPAATSSRRRT